MISLVDDVEKALRSVCSAMATARLDSTIQPHQLSELETLLRQRRPRNSL